MNKFEVGKRYKEDRFDTEIEVIKRTAKTITFRYIKPWCQVAKENEHKEFRRKIHHFSQLSESIKSGFDYSSPSIYAGEH